MKRIATLLAAASVLACGSLPAVAAGSAPSKPNVIFLLADDLGWFDNESANVKPI